MVRTLTLILAFLTIGINQLISQCTDGTQAECTCATAPVLCTVDQLDGFTFPMSSFQHPQDGPTPLCNGVNNSVPNNPTWFAFTAWCTDLTLRVSFSNCTAMNGSIGVQIAIYGDCNYGNQVACNVAPGDCNTNDKILSMSGLVIGDVYYFLVDGCLGSYCTVSIDVVGTCGSEMIAPWTLPVNGDTRVCAGDTENYSVEDLLGAGTFHWFIDGVEVGQTTDPNYTITWSTAGTYELCIDASNEPCVPISDPPPPLCVTITVDEAVAGTIMASPSPLCPGEVSTITVTGSTMSSSNNQVILITSPSGVIEQIIPGTSGTYSSSMCETVTVCSYNYVTFGNSPPFVGQNVNSLNCASRCCEVVCTDIVFEDSEAPVFPNAPGDITYDCFDGLPPMADLSWTDNCDGAGTTNGQESGSADLCSGGSITRMWEYIDGCNNSARHTQTITVNAAVPPTFTAPPADMTVPCDQIPTSAPTLTYTNGGMGGCLIEGTVTPTESGTADMCGGSITYTWDFTDACTNNIRHSQTITVDPLLPPVFINPPADITVTCDQAPTSAPTLDYTNNGTGGCLVEGTVVPTESGSGGTCGGRVAYNWTFTDPCGNTITHNQTITIDPPPAPMFINPPADVTVACDQVPASAPTLDYTNNATGSCLVEGTVIPVESGSGSSCGGSITYTWTFTDQCSNTISHTQTVTIDPAPLAAFVNPPADMTVNCDQVPTSAPTLDYTNNGVGGCLIQGTVVPTESGTADMCGGSITYTWTFTDPCSNTITHTQTITVNPPPPVTFLNPPGDMTVSCDQVPTSAPDLTYNNNGTGGCLITGAVSPIESGSGGVCGGSIIYTWTFTDQCSNTISHTQTITIDPAPLPMFLNPPSDMTVNCDQVPTSAPDLTYTNNAAGTCLVTGTVSPVETGSGNACGGRISYTWTFTDQCSNTISHTQMITISPAPLPMFLNPPPDMTVTCDNIPAGAPDLTYTNNASGGCLVTGTVSPTQSGTADICGGRITYTWTFTDQCNNTLNHTQTITVEPAPAPTFLNPPPDMTVNCDNIPSGLPPNLTYTNNAAGGCLITGTVSPIVSGTGDICGGNIIYTWTFTDQCSNTINHTQTITITPAPTPMFLNPPPDMNVTCDNIPAGAQSLTYTNNGPGACLITGSVQPIISGNGGVCNGTIINTWTFTDQCNNVITHTQTITVDPAPLPVFLNPPADITVECNNIPSGASNLTYTNSASGNCLIAGSVAPIVVGVTDYCGGIIQYDWTFVDQCGRAIQHQQTVTVNPAPEAVFLNPPAPTSMSCADIPLAPPILDYTNNEAGQCAIGGSVPAIQSGTYDACGGNISYTWVFTDNCNRTISHTQDIIVDPAPDPDFVLFPPDVTVTCNEPFPPPVDLPYSNFGTGFCEIAGTVPPTIFNNGTTVTYTWTLINPCNNVPIVHTQTISQTLPPDIIATPSQISICMGEFFDLANILVTDLNGTSPFLTYHSATPAGPGNQYPSSIVNPLVSTVYYILATNASGCTAETLIQVVVEEPPFAGFDGNGALCFSEIADVNLFDFIGGSPVQTGQWEDPGGTGVNLFNPFNVDLSSLSPGIYTFDYVLPSNGICPLVMSTATIELLPEVSVDVATIECAVNPTFYQILLDNPNGFIFVSSVGTITDLGNGQVSITDIPIGQSITITAIDPANAACTASLSISPPNCDCPTIDPPVSNGDETICEGEAVPELSVTVGIDETANWYDVAAGGTALLSGSMTYTPAVSAIGVYTYYVETENINSGCISAIRTPIQLEIVANPTGNNAQLAECDNDGDGFTLFDLTLAEDLISTDPAFSFTFHTTLADAQSGNNPLPSNFTNTLTPSQVLYVRIANQDNCSALVELTLTVNPPPTISLNVINEACLNDGNGSVQISSPTGISFSLDSIIWTASNSFTGLAVGSYTVYVEDGNGCIATQDFSIDPGLELNMEAFDINCDNNGTPSDASDDFYTITFTVNNSLGTAGTYTLNDGTGSVGVFNYGQSNSLTVPALGQSFTYTITDDALSCSITQAVGPLNSCSTDCVISLDQLDFTCNDNGTDSDPSDDFYTVNINASAINGSANNTYNVLIDGTLTYNFPYGVASSFTILADGSSPIISIIDNQDIQCQASQSIGPLTPCSDACVIQMDALDFSCNNNGSITDPSDDFYTININASAINPGLSNSFEVFADNISQGTFNYSSGGSFTLPANSSTVVISIEDADDANCTAQQNIGPLDPCDEDCTINATVSNIVCNDNGTNTDPSDDTFTFDVLVNGQNTGAGWQSTAGGLSGSYGAVQSFGPYPISGGALNFDLQDLTTASCMANIAINPPPTCSDVCEIQFDLLDFTCNDNGTLTDPSDDFYTINLNASAINPGLSNSFEVFADNVSQGVFNYSGGGSFTLPANGSTVVISIEDADRANCVAQQNIGPLTPCDEDCTINATVSNIVCDDNGTNTDPSDDTFTFDVLVNGQNLGAGWQSTSGGLSGSYGAVQSFGPYSISGGALNFDLQDLTTASCIANIAINPPGTCSDVCEIQFDLLDFTCNDNGTITDPSDDFYTINLNASAVNPGLSNSFEVFADNISQGVFNYSGGGSFTLPANGSTVVISIEDADRANCAAQQNIGPLTPCDEDCTINATVSNIVCNDNGTNTDPSDDTFTFDVLVNGQNLGAGWQSTSGGLSGSYGAVQSFGPYPISGGALNFDLQDLTTASCIANITVTPPSTCSDVCEIRFDLLDFTCNDNGTLTDPSDDFYTINLNASAVNPGLSNSFEVFADNISQGVFNYSSGGSFILPANGSTVVISIEDADRANCAAQQNIGPLTPCDEDCTINATVSNIVCNDNGTNTNPSDDTFTFDVLVNGQNLGAGWQSTSGGLSGSYGAVQSFGPYPISGGALNFDLQDLTTASCIANIAITPPSTCSDVCEIQFDLLDFTCNDNGTLTDPSDDFYTISLNASAVNPGLSNSFEVFADNILQGVFNYSSGGSFTLPANGSTVVISIEDADRANCAAQQNIGPLTPCDEDCTINATVSNIVCDDNGTNTDPSDDTFTFDVLVNGQNLGAGWQSISGGLSGSYGAVQNFGPYPISGGALNFDLQDLTTASCIANITVAPPSTCSDVCEIRFDLLDFTCNDNGTLTDPSDDFYTINLNASAVNPGLSNSFEVFADNISQGVFNYSSGGSFTLPANGSTVVISIEDADRPSCNTQQNIGPLTPCDEDCTINAIVSNIVCDDNGTGSDASDDTFTFDLLVNGQNTGAGWQATGGSLSGTYGAVQNYGPYLISGGTLNFDLQDLTTASCLVTIAVAPPSVCSTCSQTIDAGISATITCDQTSISLNGTSSDLGSYLWTGPNLFNEASLTTTAIDSGWYYLTATYPDACVAIDSVYIGENRNTPSSDAGPDLFLTCDTDTVYLDGSLSSSGTDIVYEWTNSNGMVISDQVGVFVAAAGTYFLQLTDTLSDCSSNVDAVVVVDSTAIPTAFIYADPDSVLDCQVGNILLYTDAQENVMYLWNSVPATQITVNQAGTVTLLVIDTITGCQNLDQIVIDDLSDYPFVDINPAEDLSCYSPEIVIDASNSQMGPNIIYNWYDGMNNLLAGQATDTLLVSQGGFYIFQVVDTLNGCENSDTIFIEDLADNPPLAVIDQIGALNCYNLTHVLDATGSTPFGNLTFNWTTNNGNILSGEDTPTPEIDAAGDYYLSILDIISGCTHFDTISIVEDLDEPEVMIQSVPMITCRLPETTVDASGSTSTGNLNFSWTSNPSGGIVSGDTTLTPVINQGGIFTLTILNVYNGCTSTANILVDEDTELPLAEANAEDDLDCITEEVLLSGEGSSTGNEFDYSWDGPGIIRGGTSLQPTINLPGSYQLTVLNTENGCSAVDDVVVDENTNVPQGLEAEVRPPLCQGEQGSIEIMTVDGGEGPYLYSIDGGQNYFSDELFSGLEPGEYEVKIQDAIGCEYEEVLFIPDADIIFISLQVEIDVDLGESTQLSAQTNIPTSEIDTIVWTPTEGLSCTNCLNPLVIPIEETLYTITVTDMDGCTAIASTLLKVRKERKVFIPNIFSPHNGDGINDVFMIFAKPELIRSINSFQIFDRWGELVFEDFNFLPNDPAHSWDGKLRGEPMNPAVFVYWAEVEFIDGVKKLYKGDVTLIR